MAASRFQITVEPSQVDWRALHVLLQTAYAYMDGRIEPPSSLHRMSTSGLKQKAADELLITTSTDRDLVGCLFCRPQDDWLYVGKMAVAPDQQGSGIGRRMIERAEELARDRGLLGLELETRIELVENHAAFAKLGFVKIGDQSHPGYSRPTSIRMRAPLS